MASFDPGRATSAQHPANLKQSTFCKVMLCHRAKMPRDRNLKKGGQDKVVYDGHRCRELAAWREKRSH
jgi:hypothetical protein